MTKAKIFFFLLKDKKILRKIIIAIVAVILVVNLLISNGDIEGSAQSSTSLSAMAEQEYKYWKSGGLHGYSCQGARYCGHFKTSVVDWCCYFCGFCIDKAKLNLSECGFSPACINWIINLKKVNKIKNAGTYTPNVGNLIFFDYNGRAHYLRTGFSHHIGIVTAVDKDKITVIAGNENGTGAVWATSSVVNKYTLSLNDNSICCYGTIGDEDLSTFSINLSGSTKLNKLTRNVISHNEVGAFYEDFTSAQFGSVIANDNGALSIGAYGWHANNAKNLLKTAYTINKSQIQTVANSYGTTGRRILNDVKGGANWSYFIPNQSQVNCIKAMILTKAGKTAQDRVSIQDADSYIKICKNHGVKKDKPVVYCSDILNQWGKSSFSANVYGAGNHGVLYGINGSMSLSAIYNSRAGWGSSGQYKNRRTWTYNYLKNNK